MPFSPEDRQLIRTRITAIARADARVTAGAIVGSGASDALDAFSDIDICFGVEDRADLNGVLNEWTALLAKEFGIVRHFDVKRGTAIYRVILFENGLELDLSVNPASDFGAISPQFRLLFGSAMERAYAPEPSVDEMIGWGWHHLLHANGAISRGRLWQAEYWISSARDVVLALKCLRAGVPAWYARGVHHLSAQDVASLDETLIRSLEIPELRRALQAVTVSVVDELRHHLKESEVEKIERVVRSVIGKHPRDGLTPVA